MITIWKFHIKMILFVGFIGLGISCLVTNCPRGGKRGNFLPEVLLSSSLIKEKLEAYKVHSPKSMRDFCLPKIHHTAQEVLCKQNKQGKTKFLAEKITGSYPASIIVTKILAFTLNHSKDSLQMIYG